jgi:ribonucleases P/MRP protein subunit RPP25
MENYKKGKNVEEELTKETIPIDNLPENFLWMHVKGGTKVPNVVEFAEKAFKSGEYKNLVWSGSGGGVPKTISCAEIMKRNFKLNQVTQIAYQK